MSKKVVDGIEVSDDVEVTEYVGKFSGSFELEVEKAVSMAYDDEVVLVVQARLDSYGFKPTKYGDLCRVNTFKVDSVTVKGNSNVAHIPHIVEDKQQDFAILDVEPEDMDGNNDEVFVPQQKEPERTHVLPAPDLDEHMSMVDPKFAGGRDYKDPLLARFMEEL